ncbi:MAG: GldG family protein [Defluviitaleaceae bacterium]|nr:GldG family protein [Defluviitaleaceae bacterium]
MDNETNNTNDINNENDINNNNTTPRSGGKPLRLKLGTFSTIMVIFAVAITIVVNMVVENLDLFYDLTPDQFFSISDTSNQILAELPADVTIYTLFRTGQEIAIYQQFLQSYRVFPRVNVVNIDPFVHVDFVARYTQPGQTIPVNSMIVESGDRHRVILPHEMRTTRFDIFTLSEVVETITFESVMTNAIRQVTMGFDNIIYFVTGHDEVPISAAYQQEFADWHFELRDLNITMIDRIPDDASALFITTPMRDWSEMAAQVVQDYLMGGGKAVFFIDFNNVDYPNLRRLVNYFGIDFADNAILESDTNFLVPLQGGQLNPFAIIPLYGEHTITNEFVHSDFRAMLINARPLMQLPVARQNLTIEPILISSPNSYLKDLHNFDPETDTLNREPDDTTGPFVITFAITDRNSSPNSRIVFTGTEAKLNDNFNNGTNSRMVLNMFSWAMDTLPNVWIEATPVNDNNLTFTSAGQLYQIMIISLFVIPGSILVAGTGVWLRRRNK